MVGDVIVRWRHTCVTILLNLGVPPQVVRDIVGHGDIEVTMTIYAHASLERSARPSANSATHSDSDHP
ncbi:tyrosine-type recombinase/integrase [Microtetraspora glauca]|uniref:Tyrosine-type recombinase/integrase n=1 Tax=Microtetraspora glauca TaxID=1996 RepID=A0ABV3GJT0_MICGL